MSVITKEIFFSTGKEKGSTEVCLDEGLFFNNSSIYCHAIARFCSEYSAAGYDMPISQGESEKSGIGVSLSEIGMTDIELYPESLENEVGYFFAHKEIQCKNETRNLVFAGFIGSRYGQWYTNFDAGTDETHKGFKKASDFAFDKLCTYIKSCFSEKENLVILLTGHSRGAATANLLAARLIDTDYINKDRIFTYTFATPILTRSNKTADEKYGRIFNFINDEDFVTRCMPSQWGYKRYGKTFVLPNKNNFADYEQLLKKANTFYSRFVPGDEYVPFVNGTKTVDLLFKNFVKYVPNVNDYYNKKFNLFGKKVSLYEYFVQSLCSVIGEPAGSEKIKQGIKTLIKTSVLRPASSRALRVISDFFIFYEGLAGFTKGKVFKQYFSYGHSVYTYCALVEAVSEAELKKINM